MGTNLSASSAMRKRVGIDIDGTLALFHDTFLAEYNAIHKSNYVVADFNSWNKWRIPLTLAQFMELYNDIWTKRWADVKPSVTEPTLIRLGALYDIDVITHRSKGHEPHLRSWLKLYFPSFHSRIKIHITETSESKILHDHDILFDDAPPLAEELIRNGRPKPLLFMVDQPWNENENYEKYGAIIKRVKSLEQGIELLVSAEEDMA